MTQPLPTLSTNFTRALRLLGLRPASRVLSTPLTVQPVQLIADVSDVSIPHSNPVFGSSQNVIGVAAEFSTIEIQARNRLLRIRQIFLDVGFTTPRIYVIASPSIDNIQANLEIPSGIGPRADAFTAGSVRGTRTVAIGAAAFLVPTAVIFNLRPPLLVAPGFSFCITDTDPNTSPGLSGVLWEEIPEQEAVTNIGFPTVPES